MQQAFGICIFDLAVRKEKKQVPMLVCVEATPVSNRSLLVKEVVGAAGLWGMHFRPFGP